LYSAYVGWTTSQPVSGQVLVSHGVTTWRWRRRGTSRRRAWHAWRVEIDRRDVEFSRVIWRYGAIQATRRNPTHDRLRTDRHTARHRTDFLPVCFSGCCFTHHWI